MNFDIPDKSQLKNMVQETLEQQASRASGKFMEYFTNASQTGQWPAKIPMSEIPEGVREEFEKFMLNKNINYTKTSSEYQISKPD